MRLLPIALLLALSACATAPRYPEAYDWYAPAPVYVQPAPSYMCMGVGMGFSSCLPLQ